MRWHVAGLSYDEGYGYGAMPHMSGLAGEGYGAERGRLDGSGAGHGRGDGLARTIGSGWGGNGDCYREAEGETPKEKQQ